MIGEGEYPLPQTPLGSQRHNKLFSLIIHVSVAVTFSTGARDGNIMVWDIRCNVPVRDGFYKPVITIRNAHTVQINTPQRVKKRSRRVSVAKPVVVSIARAIQCGVVQHNMM